MFTQIITIFNYQSLSLDVLCMGESLIKTEKVDAVFGNPERAKGGTHWIIVGSSVILLTVALLFMGYCKRFLSKISK